MAQKYRGKWDPFQIRLPIEGNWRERINALAEARGCSAAEIAREIMMDGVRRFECRDPNKLYVGDEIGVIDEEMGVDVTVKIVDKHHGEYITKISEEADIKCLEVVPNYHQINYGVGMIKHIKEEELGD